MMSDPTRAFWDDLVQNLEDPEFLREYIVESVRVESIDRVMNTIEDSRAMLGLSKSDLARAINANPATIRRLLSSKNSNPTLGTLTEVAAVLGYSITLTPLSRTEQQSISEPLRSGTTDDPLEIALRFAIRPAS